MRGKHTAVLGALSVLAVAAAAVVAGHAVAAQPAETPRAAPAGSGRPAVTLPTGDRVLLTGDGAIMTKPAAGREDVGFYRLDLPGADRVIIPLDVLDDVRAGTVDARLFDVDSLLRNGFTDARTVSSPERLGAPIGGTDGQRDTAATPVTLRYAWSDGSAPEAAGGIWLNLDTGDVDFFAATDGVAELALAPGNYSIVADMNEMPEEQRIEVIGTTADLTVTADPVDLTIDGSQGRPVGFAVDRADAVLAAAELKFFAYPPASDDGVAGVYLLGGADTMSAIPSTALDGHAVGITLRGELGSPPEAAEPYSYSLFDKAESGVPTDPRFVVHDEDLAVRHATYHSLGGKPAQLARANLSQHETHRPTSYVPGAAVQVPSTRTELYTVDPDVSWSHLGTFGGANDTPSDDVLHHSGAMTAGEADESWLAAPLSVRAPDPRFPYYGSGTERWPYTEGYPELLARMPMFAGGADGEMILSWDVPGEAVISKDGTELGRDTNGSAVVADLPADDSGRYTVTMDATREVPWTVLGTHSTAKWGFDSVPATEDTVVGVSAVRFSSAAVVDGYAEAGTPHKVGLDFETQPGAEDRQCQDMTFDVSYDDGATWTKVELDRDGDHATATLRPPADVTFVSVRFTAADDKGQTVETTTIRSYGLR